MIFIRIHRKLKIHVPRVAQLVRLGNQISIPGRGRKGNFSLATAMQPPVQLVPRFYPRGYTGQGVKLTTNFHLLPRLTIHGAIPPLPRKSSRYGA